MVCLQDVTSIDPACHGGSRSGPPYMPGRGKVCTQRAYNFTRSSCPYGSEGSVGAYASSGRCSAVSPPIREFACASARDPGRKIIPVQPQSSVWKGFLRICASVPQFSKPNAHGVHKAVHPQPLAMQTIHTSCHLRHGDGCSPSAVVLDATYAYGVDMCRPRCLQESPHS